MTLKLRIVLLLLGTALLVAPAVEAQEIGKREYLNNCAVCHGTLGKGDGPFAAQLKKTPADLTKIEKNNLGVFPFDRIYEIIDGREAVAAHGPRDMPVWGTDIAPRLLG